MEDIVGTLPSSNLVWDILEFRGPGGGQLVSTQV